MSLGGGKRGLHQVDLGLVKVWIHNHSKCSPLRSIHLPPHFQPIQKGHSESFSRLKHIHSFVETCSCGPCCRVHTLLKVCIPLVQAPKLALEPIFSYLHPASILLCIACVGSGHDFLCSMSGCSFPLGKLLSLEDS